MLPTDGQTEINHLDDAVQADQSNGDCGVADGADADGHEEGVVEVDEVGGGELHRLHLPPGGELPQLGEDGGEEELEGGEEDGHDYLLAGGGGHGEGPPVEPVEHAERDVGDVAEGGEHSALPEGRNAPPGWGELEPQGNLEIFSVPV